MSAGPEDRQQPDLRASDAERQVVVDRLNRAAGEGRLTLAEFGDRAGIAYSATTRAELEPLVADLPTSGAAGTAGALEHRSDHSPIGTVSADAAALQHVPIGAIKRAGRWQLGPVTRMKVSLGPVKLDLSGAQVAASEVDLHVRTSIGSIKVWVPDGVRVVVDGATTMGTRTVEEDSAPGPGPLVRLHLDTWMGTVKVYRV